MKFLLGVLFTVIVAIIGVYAVVASGRVYVGADEAHNPIVHSFLKTALSSSLEHASKDIIVPNLEQVDMISSGGADYKDMCAGCHLAPDATKTDLSEGLYPRPPNFTNAEVVARYSTDTGAKRSFWAIKHGIMASGMPAWGVTHDDDRMWAMVAFIRALPELDADQYTMLTTRFDSDIMDMSFDMDMSDDSAEMQH